MFCIRVLRVGFLPHLRADQLQDHHCSFGERTGLLVLSIGRAADVNAAGGFSFWIWCGVMFPFAIGADLIPNQYPIAIPFRTQQRISAIEYGKVSRLGIGWE